MYYLPKSASRARLREAQRARNNRAEIIRARSIGQVTRRELIKWGAFTASGLLVCKNGLSPFARSAFADDIPTGTPASPLRNVAKFTAEMPRLNLQTPVPLTRAANGNAVWPSGLGEPDSKRLSYHEDFSNFQGPPEDNPFRNPITNKGPMEGRPPTEVFAHQRWNEFFPKVGYLMNIGSIAPNTRFHPQGEVQNANSVWTWGPGKSVPGARNGVLPPFLIKGRYGEPILFRAYQALPVEREHNGGFGRNETQLHFHNAHNGAESDGASNVHHFPGTFFDYLWGTALARTDRINTGATEPRASGPDGNGGLVKVPGDFREIQGTMWAHDHRFFFTAENVYKGNLGMINYYSGPDRGNEELNDGVNLRLPSGSTLDSGNLDFDVNLIFSDAAFDQDDQYFFDIFAVDGFLGDIPLVNFVYAPYMKVLPRKYRFRILNACMSRFVKLALSYNGSAVPFWFIANDGNLVVNPIRLTSLDQQGIAERYDIVVDFSAFPVGTTQNPTRIKVVNRLVMREDGRGPDEILSLREALRGEESDDDPLAETWMEFHVVDQVESVDMPGSQLTIANSCGANDKSVELTQFTQLTEQIPIVQPVRTRLVEFGRSGNGDSRDPITGECTPECPEPEIIPDFPWSVKVNGEDAHTFNANRISLLVPKAGEVEHWTYVNGGGGWDHPIHLHFEEGVTIHRGRDGRDPIPDTERLVRKDVWRVGTEGDRSVTFQVQFGEYGGAYVNHCHNTVHEDFAMLLRLQLLSGVPGSPQAAVTPTPNPTPYGVFFTTPEILPEGDPGGSTI